jgi:KDO2-lipid IV(A) lauroyltransferase
MTAGSSSSIGAPHTVPHVAEQRPIEVAGPVVDRVALAAAMAIGRLPWGALRPLGAGVGRLFATVDRRKRGRVQENLVPLGLSASGSVRRELWGHVARSYLEILWLSRRRTADAAPGRLRVEGLEQIREAARPGRGVVVASAHLGAWELTAVAGVPCGVPVAVVARPMRVASIERGLVAWRLRCGVETFVRDRPGASVAAYRWLARGGVLGCMIDRAGGGRRLLVPFLGRGTHVPMGPAVLAHRAGSALALGLTRREPDGSLAVRFRRIATDGAAGPEDLARAMAAALEKEIRRTPAQWLWLYRSQPELERPEE